MSKRFLRGNPQPSHRVRVFENKILWQIFGPKRDANGGVEKAPQ
jgi:hypothetical protein